jgi:serine/threonine protein kinase
MSSIFRDVKPGNIIKILPSMGTLGTLGTLGTVNSYHDANTSQQDAAQAKTAASAVSLFITNVCSFLFKPKSELPGTENIEPQIKKAFSEVDVDNSGFITMEEFGASRFAANMSREEVKSIFDQIDATKNRTIDIFEWNVGVQAGLILLYAPGDPRNEALSKPKAKLDSLREGQIDTSQHPTLPGLASANAATSAKLNLKRTGTMVTSALGGFAGHANQATYKLIDLGTCVGIKEVTGDIGNAASESLLSLTAIQFQGTPAYSSPENFNDLEKVAFATDVWSLAASMFHLVSNKLPFDARTPLAASVNIAGDMEAKPPDVREAVPEELRANISSAFAEVLKKGLEKKIENRYQSISMFQKALHGCLVQKGEEMYSAFISYRVFSEKYHASLLYDALNNSVTPAGHRVIVYLDAKRLVKGEGWEEGFSLGLMNSLVALPMISSGVLRPMQDLKGLDSDRPDNVCKELLIMQSLLGKAGKLEAIYPILVGPPLREGDANYPGTDDFFARNGALISGLADVRSPATMDAAAEFLKARNAASAGEAARGLTVKATVKKILDIQGAQLWKHDVLEAEPVPEDSELWHMVSSGPPDPPLDRANLEMLRAEIRALLPGIHQVIDRANARRNRDEEPRNSRWTDLVTLALTFYRQRSHAHATNLQLWQSLVRTSLALDRRGQRERLSMLRECVDRAINGGKDFPMLEGIGESIELVI